MTPEKYETVIRKIQKYYKESTDRSQESYDPYAAGKSFAYGMVLDMLEEEKPEIES